MGRFPRTKVREPLLLVRVQVPGILQQEEAGALDGHPVSAAQAADLLAADEVQGVVEVPDQVKAVKQDLRLGSIFVDGSQVGRPHVQADDLDGLATAAAEVSKEGGQSLGGAILADPQQDAALQIVGHSQIVVTLATTDLIDPQDVQGLAFPMAQTIGHCWRRMWATVFQFSW